MLNRYRPHALLLFALIGASGCSDRSAPQPQRNTTRVETNNDVLPAHVVQVLPYRMEAPGDGPVQVVLFGDGFEFVSQLVLGKAGSSTPIAGDPITVAPATGPSQIAPIRQLTVVLTRDQIANADWVAVVDKDGQQGKPFYFREVSERHPDLVRINSTVIAVDTGEPLVVLGHHHFDHTSTLLVDDQPLDAAQFTVERGDNGAFRLTIADPASLGLGAHRLRLENAPRDPLAAVAQSLPFVPFASTELAFEVVETSTAELALTGADLTVTLDGATGALRRIDQLSSGRSYHLDTQHPWRLRVRQLAQDTTRSHSNSPLVKQLVDPVTAGCRQSLTAVPLPLTNGQGLRLHWSGCKLDHHAPETNRFEVTQELT
ncbi:MAG TPA: hypothetical protein ENK23_05920, partial [Sorangium sp.]|nr:hypothetical protein [Sorangium sp.]